MVPILEEVGVGRLFAVVVLYDSHELHVSSSKERKGLTEEDIIELWELAC